MRAAGPRSGRALLFAVGVIIAVAIVVGYSAQRDRGDALERLELGTVEDVLGEEAGLLELAGGAPAAFLVGGPSDVEALLAARAGIADRPGGMDCWTVVRSEGVDAIALEALRTRLVEAALDDGGGIALDASGATARALLGPLDGATLVRVGAESVLEERVDLADRSPAELAERLGDLNGE